MPGFIHKPVMVAEVLEALRPQSGGRYADGTLGGCGHALAILESSSPNGWLFGCDRDGDAVEAARQRLAAFAGRFELRQDNFANLTVWVTAGSCDGVLLDLGVSSPQLDQADRGFSFQADGPLDMRMNRQQGRTAAELVNEVSVDELAGIFGKYGEERHSRKIARAIEEQRQRQPIETTTQLAELVEKVTPRHGRKTHPATRVFQALRIEVNDELSSLENGLKAGLSVLTPGGRMAVISFHSLEDRRVKRFGRDRARDYEIAGDVDVPELRTRRQPELRLITRKPIRPSEAEMRDNPRSRSAKLRVMEKL